MPGSLLLTTNPYWLLVLSARKNIDQGMKYNREEVANSIGWLQGDV